MSGWPMLNVDSHEALNEPRQIAEIEVLDPLPATPKRKRTKLADCRSIRSELGRVYRQARSGEIDTATATRLAYILDLMSRMIERGELEARIAVLESERRE